MKLLVLEDSVPPRVELLDRGSLDEVTDDFIVGLAFRAQLSEHFLRLPAEGNRRGRHVVAINGRHGTYT